MHPIKCLLAVEAEAVGIIRSNLEKVYKDEIVFYSCSHGQELPQMGNIEPDIVIVSRFLPKGGKNDKEFLGHLNLLFPTAHIIILAGTESEQRRVFLEIAAQCGITDYVTGKLPGDRPYTIFEAINQAKERILEGMSESAGLVWEDGEHSEQPAEEGQRGWQSQTAFQPAVPFQWQAEQSQQAQQRVEQMSQPIPPSSVPLQSQINFAELGYIMQNGPTRPMMPLQPQPRAPLIEGCFAQRRQGILVVPSANKGGVGKTTTGISLAVVLAKMAVPTVIVDYNFGGPNVASFFDIKDVPGVEVLAHRNVRPNTVADLLVEVRPNLHVLPGPMDKTVPLFEAEQLVAIIQILQQMFSVVICDTPPEFWTKPWLGPIFALADYVLAVVDQSLFSIDETKKFAPYMLAMGAKPETIKIVLNRFDPKLHNPRVVEKAFCSGFKKNVKPLPKVAVVIPNNWREHVKKSYKGEVAGVDDERYSQWHKLASEIIKKAGISAGPAEEKKGFFGGIFKKKK